MDFPSDLEGAFDALDQRLSPEDREAIRGMTDEAEFVVDAHFGLGLWIRNNLGLWGSSRLKKVFLDAGVWHPDSMSGVILHAYYRRLHDQPLALDELLTQAKKEGDVFDWL